MNVLASCLTLNDKPKDNTTDHNLEVVELIKGCLKYNKSLQHIDVSHTNMPEQAILLLG